MLKILSIGIKRGLLTSRDGISIQLSKASNNLSMLGTPNSELSPKQQLFSQSNIYIIPVRLME